ncbi:ankyrin [Aureobasidium pullulans]|uniref:Ankyrin n=1 Tax=Aureobasidium pullulans TaxID=5580 RepID=A0A4S9TCF1_AURPU|nr:ankyrin [Aureobasidium pullulans]
MREEMKQKFRWLSTVPVQSHHAKAHEDLVPDTGSWLMERHHFIDWKQSSKSCAILLHGSLGCGKTKLMSVLVQQLLDEQKANPEAPKVAYFYCNGSEQQRTKVQEILGAIARQLSWNGIDQPPEQAFLDAYSIQRKDADEKNADQIDHLGVKALTELIPRIVGEGVAVVLIDALDECTERLELLRSIKTIVDKVDVKVIISGRSEVCQDMPKDEFPIHILIGHGANRDDIRKYVTTEVDRAILDKRLLRGKVGDQLKETIVRKLNDSAQGMFLWVKLQLQTLCEDGIKREKDVLIELERNPTEIGQLYESIFDRITRSGPSSREIAESVLRWLLVSRRPLTTTTILEAVSEAGDSDLEKNEVLDVCRNLVVADDETDTFRFAHLSVQEFLQKKEGFGEDALHTFAALRCLEEFESTRRSKYDDDNARPDPNSASFYAYAVVNWIYHSLMVKGGRREDLVDKLESFFRDEEAFSDWNHDSLESDERQNYFLMDTDFESPCLSGHKATPTFAIAKLGLISAFDEQEDLLDWNYNNIKGQAPIHVAAFAGHLEIVQRLIERGMDINHRGDKDYSPLLAACVGRHRNIVEYLLSLEGVEVNRRSRFGKAPLIAASRAGDENICRLLLDKGAVINLQANDNDTALTAASECGKLSVVQTLLKHGADTEIVGRLGGNALLAAAVCREGQWAEIIKLLARAGANLDAQDAVKDTALHMAAQAGELDMVRFLVMKKAKVSIQNIAGKTALDFACAGNQTKIIEYLLKNGATCEPDTSGRTELHEAIDGGCDVDILKLFVSKGVDVNAKDNAGIKGALHLAARRGEHAIVQVLIDAEADMNIKSSSGQTLLHEAARGGSADVVRRFLAYGVDIEARNKDEQTPLAVACCESEGSDDVVRVFLDAGAKVVVGDKWGYTPLHRLAGNMRRSAAMMLLENGNVDMTARTNSDLSFLDLAAQSGDYELVRSLLEHGAGIQPEAASKQTPLHLAVMAEKQDKVYAIVERLLEEGCDVNARDDHGCTPLHAYLSLNEGKENIVQLFFSQGADIDVQDNDGDTVLNCLTEFKQPSELILRLLLKNGADLNLGNYEGMTPLHNLARSGLASHVRIILEAGANPMARDKHNRQPIQYAAKTNEATVRALLDFKADVNVTGSDWPSPIVYASSEANLQVLRLLLDGGADARSEDPENPGWTALHAACKRVDPDPAFAELLIVHGADVNIATTVSKTTPLHNAVNSAAVVQLLLKMGACVDARDSENKTPLMCACETVASAQVVEILIDAGADPMIKDKTYGATGLHYSCFSDDFAPVVIASSKCVEIDVRDKSESTPLMWASWNAHPGAVKELLKAGSVDTCVTKAGGINAFLYAVMDGYVEVVKLLLVHNPGIITAVDKRKNTALHFACREGRLDVLKLLLDTDASNIGAVNSKSYTAFDEAAKGGHTDIVAFMLARDDVDPHHRSVRDSTPLLLAVYTGKKDLIEMLMNVEGTDLAHGSTGGMTLFKMAAFMGLASLCRTLIEKGVADCTIPSKTGGFYPLHYAATSGNVEVIELLLSQPGVDKNVVSMNGYTPLCDAVRMGRGKSVETLLAHNVEVDTPDNRGRTPLLIASQKSNQNIVKALLGAGAKAELNDALSIALTNRDEGLVQLLKNAGAIEQDEDFGIEELMKMATLGDVNGIEALGTDTGDTATAKEPQAISGAECVEEDLTS